MIDQAGLKVDFHITDDELDSYQAWRKLLESGPITSDKITADHAALAHRMAKELDGYGVTLTEVTPVSISRHKMKVLVRFKYLEKSNGTQAS